MNPYREIFEALEQAQIRYLIVGGVAVNLLGHRRFTADLDILLALEPENLEKMTTLMHDLGYIERLPITLNSLSDASQVERWLKEKGMTAYTFLSNTRQRIDIDVLTGASLQFATYDKRKSMVTLDGGLSVPVIAVEDLLHMKREANRPKDLLDIEILLSWKGL